MDLRRSRPTAALITIWLATLPLAPAANAQSTSGQSTSERDRGAAVAALPPAPTPVEQGYVRANGIAYHYQLHGEGEPLLLLHGGLGATEMFAPVLPILAEGRRVIGVDLHGHGRTELGDRPIDLIAIADDLAILIESLGYEQVDIVGYSLGGGAALRLAAQHPERVRRLAIVSAGFARDGYFPEILEQQSQLSAAAAPFMAETPMYQSYMALAPEPERFPELLDRMGELMRRPYDWSDDVRNLAVPTLLVFGDSDMYRLEHILEFYRLLGGGVRDGGWMGEGMGPNRLAILPGRTHYDIFMAPEMVRVVRAFLD